MGRNRGFTGALVQIQRESERQARAQAAAATRAARETERAHRAYERAQAAEAKEYQRLYVESRMADVDLRNEELQNDVAALQQLLADTLTIDDFLDFEALKEAVPLPVFAPGPLASPEPPPNPDDYRPPEPTGLRARLPGAPDKHQAKWEESRVAYEATVVAYQQREAERQRRLAAAQVDHDKTVAEIEARLDFARVDAEACLLDLSASLSKSPAELVPVRPVLEFNLVDPRFVEEAGVLSGLDQRPNLMELKPGEFESLITNLFTKMGLETRMTQPSRDGGVDCVAYDNRAIFGGKVIIQAKRYKNTVPVSAVRDLFGTVHNEGATKGILVTTSGYGKASLDFANDKPLELLSGTNLIYLLKEHAQVDAKIEPPEHWVDPKHDTGPAHWDEPPSGS